MKYYIYTIVYIISFVTNAQGYIFESNSNNTILKTIIYPDGQEYIHIEHSVLWKDNKGDFGIPYTINIGKNDVRIYRYCLEPDDFYLDKKLKKD